MPQSPLHTHMRAHTHTPTQRLSPKVRMPARSCSHRKTSCTASPLSFFIVCLWCPMCAHWLSFNPSQHTHTYTHTHVWCRPLLFVSISLSCAHTHTQTPSLCPSAFYCKKEVEYERRPCAAATQWHYITAVTQLLFSESEMRDFNPTYNETA